jgi:hypothetical protein
MLRGPLISLAIICAASTPFVLFPRGNNYWISSEQIFAVVLFFPIILISISLSIYGFCKLGSWRSDPFFPFLTFISLVFPGTIAATATIRTIGHEMYLAEESRRNQWLSYGKTLNPLIIEYIRQHPDKVTFPFNDDRACVEGLVQCNLES